MKSILKSFLMTCMFLTSFSFLDAQSSLSVVSCNQLEATFELSVSQSVSVIEFVLERQLIEGVWQKLSTTKETAKKTLFVDLPKGTYRVSVIPEQTTTGTTKLHFKEKGAIASGTTVFVSNAVTLTGEELPCDNSVNHKELSKSKNFTTARNNDITFFPNPANTNITFQFPARSLAKEGLVTIHDINGKVLLEKIISRTDKDLSIHDLQIGIYLIEIKAEGEDPIIKKMLIMR